MATTRAQERETVSQADLLADELKREYDFTASQILLSQGSAVAFGIIFILMVFAAGVYTGNVTAMFFAILTAGIAYVAQLLLPYLPTALQLLIVFLAAVSGFLGMFSFAKFALLQGM